MIFQSLLKFETVILMICKQLQGKYVHYNVASLDYIILIKNVQFEKQSICHSLSHGLRPIITNKLFKNRIKCDKSKNLRLYSNIPGLTKTISYLKTFQIHWFHEKLILIQMYVLKDLVCLFTFSKKTTKPSDI